MRDEEIERKWQKKKKTNGKRTEKTKQWHEKNEKKFGAHPKICRRVVLHILDIFWLELFTFIHLL